MTRLLDALRQRGEIGVCALQGGVMRLAIPTEAEAVVCFAPEAEKKMLECVRAAAETMAQELAVSGKKLHIEAEPWGAQNTCVMAEALLPALMLCPDGICQMNEALEGMVDIVPSFTILRIPYSEMPVSLANSLIVIILGTAFTGGVCLSGFEADSDGLIAGIAVYVVNDMFF